MGRRKAADSSIEGKSSDELKEMLEQPSGEVISDEEPEKGSEEIEVVEDLEEIEGEAKSKKSLEEEPKGEPELEVSKEELHRLIVEGKEEQWPLSKVIEFAQKGRYLEREKAKLNAEKEALRKTKEPGGPASPFGNLPPEKFNEYLVEELNKNPAATLFNLIQMGIETDHEKSKSERKADKEFELEKADDLGELWRDLKPRYQDFRELGYSREESLAKAEADFWKDFATKSLQQGMKKGEKKAQDRLKAEMPSGEKKTSPAGLGFPSEQELKRMKSGDILKLMKKVGRYNKVEGW